MGPGPCDFSTGGALPDRSGSRRRPAYQPAAAIPADRRAPRAPPRPLMHFLFPSPSVETVFPVSDLHCPLSGHPLVDALTRPAPAPSTALEWAGKEAAPCLPDQLLHRSNLPSSWRFSTPPGRVPHGLAAWLVPAPITGSTAMARSSERPDRREGLFPVAPPPLASPPARPALLPPPESITTARRASPERTHHPLRQVCGHKRNARGSCCSLPAWLAGKAAGPARSRTLVSTHSGTDGSGRRARAPQPGPVPVDVRISPFFLYNHF